LKSRKVKTADCIPLPELERQFYDQSNYRYLRRIIETEGFKPCYPIRGVFNKRKDVYEIFDGIHRLKVSQDLGISKIPLIDETGVLTRQQAIAEGIKANKTHAYYNPIDMAKHLKVLGEALTAVRKRKRNSVGRPEKVSLALLAQETGMSEKSISQYLQLLRLPEDVQTMVGQGKIKFSYALVLLRLDKTAYKHMIPKLAQDVYKQGISRRELERKVEVIRKKGYFVDTKVCVGCKRAFPKDSVSNPCLCPECVGKLRSGNFEATPNKERTKAMQKFLKVNRFVQKRKKEGKEVPAWLEERLERLHERWEKERGWERPDLFGD